MTHAREAEGSFGRLSYYYFLDYDKEATTNNKEVEELGEQHHDQHKCITKQSPFPTTWYDFMMSLILPSGTCANASFPPQHHQHQYFHYLVKTLCRSEPDLKLDVRPRSDLLEVLTVWLGWCTSWASCLYTLQDVSSCNNNKDAINALTAGKNAAFAKQRVYIGSISLCCCSTLCWLAL